MNELNFLEACFQKMIANELLYVCMNEADVEGVKASLGETF